MSIDQLELTMPGLIAQLKEIPTSAWYNAATISVNHLSRLSYVHLKKVLTSKEMVKTKQAFEAFAATHGVTIKHYHANNVRFQDNFFYQAIQDE